MSYDDTTGSLSELEPYSIVEAQALVEDAKKRMRGQHVRWAAMRSVYRTGRWSGDAPGDHVLDAEGRLLDGLPDIQPETLNLTLSHMNVLVASIIDRDPQHTAVPVSGGMDAEGARHAVESLIRHMWRRTDGTRPLGAATWDMALVGNGFLKVYGEALEHEQVKPLEELDAELRQAAIAEMQAAAAEGRDADLDTILGMVQPVKFTDDWQAWAEHVRPEDMFVGIDCKDIRSASWVAQRVVVPADEVRSNPDYKAAIDAGCTVQCDTYRAARGGIGSTDSTIGTAASDRPFEYSTLYEFYDMRTRRLMVFQLGAEKPLYEGDLPYSHPYPPFVHLGNYKDGDEFWCFGEIENIASIQEMVNELVEEQARNAHRAGNKYVADANKVTPELVSVLESDEHDVVAKLDLGNGQRIEDVFQAIPRRGLSEDVYRTDAMLRQGMSEVLGINDFQQGGVGADRMSATAASLVEGIATIRAADKIRQVERAAAHAGQLMLMLAQEFMPPEVAVRIVGPDDQPAWEMVQREAIGGQYLVSVQPESTKALNPQARQQKALQGFETIIPALIEMGWDPEPAARSFLRDMGLDPEVLMSAKLPPPEPEGAPVEDPMAQLLADPMMQPGGDPMGLGTGAALDATSAGFPEAEQMGGPLA